MKTSKEKQTETTEKQVSSSNIPETLEQVEEIQRVINFFSNYKGADPTILRAKQKFYKAQKESIFDGIANAHFGLIREGDNSEGRFMI